MNMKKLIYKLLALLVLTTWTACSPENLLNAPDDGKDTENTDPNKRELVITMQKELKVGSGAMTRAIATDAENEINTLDIYVFASASEMGEYTFMKKYSYSSDPIQKPIPAGAEEVKLQMIAGQPSVTLRPEKGMYVKLYCVANQQQLYSKSEITKVPDGGGDPTGTGKFEYKEYTDFKELKQSAPGGADNVITVGVPTEEDFKKLATPMIDITDKKGYISPSLVMSGTTLTTIDLKDFSAASRLLRGVKLVRAVARFDIINDPEKTKFTPDSATVLNGRPLSTLFPIEAQKGEIEKAEDTGLIKYPVTPITGFQPKNNVYPICYSYGSSKDDKGELVLIGRYAINKTQEQKVSYKIPFMQTKGTDALYLEINPNHRYTVEILEANLYEVKFNFIVKEWDEGDDVDIYDPDNKIHLKMAAGNNVNNKYQERNNRLFMYLAPTTGAGSIITEVTANSEFEIVGIDYTPGSTLDWLKLETEDITPVPPTPDPAPVTRAIAETTGKIFKITLTSQNVPTPDDGKRPMAYLKIKNKATGETTKYEVIALPQIISSNFKIPLPVGDYLVSNTTIANYQQSQAINAAKKAGTKWRLPSMDEYDELFGFNETKPWNTLTNAEQSSYMAIPDINKLAEVKKLTLNGYWWSTTDAIAGSTAWRMYINTDYTVRRLIVNATSNGSFISIMKYDENQP